MDAIAPPPKAMQIELQSSADQGKCFHGFAHGVTPKAHMFELKSVIGAGGWGQVFQVKCATDRKCDVAIKVIPLIGSQAHHAAVEKKIIQTLMKNPHSNIVEYFGVLEEDGKMYIVMELGEKNLDQLLKENISNISIPQFHEIIFQILEIINYLDSINVFYNDFKKENILYLGKKIKLIDFDSIADSYPLSRLADAAYFLSELQFEMKLKSTDSDNFEPFESFTRAIRSSSFTDADAKTLSEKNDVWHDELPSETKKLLSRCFIRKTSSNKEIIENRHLFTPRDDLVF